MRLTAAVLAIILLGAVLGLWWYTRPSAIGVNVYFIREKGTAFTVIQVERKVRARDTAALVAGAMRELLAGPTDPERVSGFTTAIPKGTTIRRVRVEQGIVIVDFSSSIESGGGSASMLGRFWQIVYTATQFPAAPRVRILIEGEQRASMGGEGVVIDRPIARPPVPPRF